MNNLATRRRDAERVCRSLGHWIEWNKPYGYRTGWDKDDCPIMCNEQIGTCKCCQANVVIRDNPPAGVPVDIGTALTEFCQE